MTIWEDLGTSGIVLRLRPQFRRQEELMLDIPLPATMLAIYRTGSFVVPTNRPPATVPLSTTSLHVLDLLGRPARASRGSWFAGATGGSSGTTRDIQTV